MRSIVFFDEVATTELPCQMRISQWKGFSAKICLPWTLAIGNKSHIGEWALICNLGPVTICERVTVSHRAQLCAGTHDYSDSALPLLRLSITIEAKAWVCAGAFFGPDVTVREAAIAGAAATVTRDVEPWVIVAGNLASFIKKRQMQARVEVNQ